MEQKMDPKLGTDAGLALSSPSAKGRLQKPDWKRLFGLREMGVYYALILLVLVLTVATTYMDKANYFSVLNLSNVVYQSSLTAIMAVAMTVVLITGNFDLSVASVAALAAVILIGNADAIGYWPAFVLALGVGMSMGLLNGVIVQFVGINAFIVRPFTHNASYAGASRTARSTAQCCA